MAKLSAYTVNNEYKWHVIYTRLNHEKAVEKSLLEQGIEVYLPKRKTLRTWSDRKKWVEEPLFRPYIFVYVSNREYHKVLSNPSVFCYISFEGQAATIPASQINLIRSIIEKKFDFEVSRVNLKPGKKVIIKYGILAGYKAEIISVASKNRLSVRIDELNCSLLFNIGSQHIRPCG